MIIKIDPVSKPRMTQRDKWAKRSCVMKYRAFADELRLKYKLAGGVPEFEDLSLNFYIKMPDSWSKKRKTEMNGKPHQQKPDIDNLIKGFFDILLKDDSGVHSISASKYWSREGMIGIDIFK